MTTIVPRLPTSWNGGPPAGCPDRPRMSVSPPKVGYMNQHPPLHVVLRRGVIWSVCVLLSIVLAPPASADPTDEVNPWIGTGGGRPWFSGNTTPAASLPFGMVQLGPDTTSNTSTGAPSASASGYSYSDTHVRGFSPTHLSGAGASALGDVPVLPVPGALPADPGSATSPLDHGREKAGPGWYTATLGNGTRVRLAAALRSGVAEYTFPAGVRRGHLLVKSTGSLGGVHRASTRFPNDRTVVVAVRARAMRGFVESYKVYVRMEFNRPFTAHGQWGAREGGWLRFPTRKKRTVRARIGVSFVDAPGAANNLRAARTSFSYLKARDSAVRLWDRELDRVSPAGGTASERTTFRTALAHAFGQPLLDSDADRRHRAFDGTVRRVPRGHRNYTAIGGWDVYRTQMPLLAWLRPDVASDIARSLVRAAKTGGFLPRWPFPGQYTQIMNGDSAAPTVAAAWAFNARDFPLRRATRLLSRQAERTDLPPGQGWFTARPGSVDYLAKGYVPNTTPERLMNSTSGGSTTLEYATDDFALSRLARATGLAGISARARQRSGNWRTLLDPDRALLLPRDAAGSFPPADYRVNNCCDGFQEGSAAQYTWMVPHDMGGLLSALGTEDQVLARLQHHHERLNKGAGQYAWLGNQPSLATPWAYLWLGRPDLTQEVVARARTELWSNSPDGLPGNDDLGSLSSWYVWAALGLYPLTPGTSAVGISVPAFESVTVRARGRRPMVIRRTGDGARVSNVLLGGKPQSASWFNAGRRWPRSIEIRTTDDPSPTWGTHPTDRPPSWPVN